ncbi:hypothetical protein LINPERHAP1_LOCUS20458 [Linum perenne]
MVNATTWSCLFLSLFLFSSSMLVSLTSADDSIMNSDSETAKRAEIRRSPALLQLPRKLRLMEEVASVEVPQSKDKAHLHDVKMYKEEDGASTSGKSYEKKKEEGEGDEEGEGTDTTQYWTMDYSRVRKRRPIHNKSLPRGP